MVGHHGRRIGPALCPPQQGAQVVHHGLEDADRDPAGLSADRLPGREVGRQHAPACIQADDPPQGVGDFAWVMHALESSGTHQREVRGDKRPLLIGHVGPVGLLGLAFYAPGLPSSLQVLR